jgi:hypothetical protein
MSQLTNLITGKKKDKQPGDKKDEKKTKKRINNFLNEKSLQKKWKILTKFMGMSHSIFDEINNTCIVSFCFSGF